ncbi:8997_t:CDS:2 [Diversispora eburnea]|uniref:8997_t:CDS:1 n=1 Tax=Diversispora eburnea TaxID=1213867 RepID=A0A9N8Z2C5_9GLOM|nr:8997_t:CDS:2 [Diversispora eburnea]
MVNVPPRPKERTVTEYQQLSRATPEIKNLDLSTPNTPTLQPIPSSSIIDVTRQQQQQLSSPSSLQVSATSFLDPRTKKIVALEANRLSKKSRSYSMYTLADQLKTVEASRSWSSSSPLPITTTTNTTTSSKQQAKNSLPYQLKWLEDLATRESKKLQPTITDANSIRANPVRPKTSADFRNYQNENENENIEDIFSTSPPLSLLKSIRKIEKIEKIDKNDLDNYNHPITNSGIGKSSLVRTKSSADLQRSKSSCGSPLRNSILTHHVHELKDPKINVRRRNHERESLNRDTYIDERRRDYENLYNRDNVYDEKRRDVGYDERKRDIGYDERRKDIRYDERKKDIGYDERKKDIGYDERTKDIGYDEKRRDIGYDEKRRDIGYDEKRRDIGYDERKRDNFHEERRRDNVHEERRRDNVHEERRRDNVHEERRRDSSVYDERKRDSVHDERKRDNVHDERRRDSVYDERRRDNIYDSHHKDYDGYNKIRQQDNGFDGRRNSSRLDNHDDYEPRYNNNKISEQHEQYNSRGHTRNSSYASSSISSVLNDDGQPLSANHSYLERIRHKSSFSDTSSISSPSSPATPNGLYDNIEQRWKPNNGLDPRIYKEQTYASSIISKTSSRSSWQVDDINKDRYHHHSNGLNKRQSQSHLASLMLKDRPLTSMGIRSPSTPRSYSSMQSSPSYTRDSSPTRDSLYHSSSRRHHNYQRVTSPVYSSRPVSRASVSSSATSIEEESAILTDMLKDADGLTMKNLTSQMSLFKARDFKSVAPGIDITAKPKPKTSRSTPTPSIKRTSTLSVSTASSRALSTPTPSKKSTNKTTAVTANGTKTSSRTPSNTKTGSKTTPVAKGVKGTTGAGQPKSKKLPNGSSNKSTSNSGNNINISSYRAAYRPPPQPTDFSEARAALNRAKLKVEEMLEIVSNGGSPF